MEDGILEVVEAEEEEGEDMEEGEDTVEEEEEDGGVVVVEGYEEEEEQTRRSDSPPVGWTVSRSVLERKAIMDHDLVNYLLTHILTLRLF